VEQPYIKKKTLAPKEKGITQARFTERKSEKAIRLKQESSNLPKKKKIRNRAFSK